MASVIGWLDYSEEHRQQMREIIDLFKDEDSVDELGIGSIRDTFADIMFPGLSTVQTRARYFLLVPWVYQRIEREKIPSSQAAARARNWQYDLVVAMRRGEVGGGQGVIGWDAGRDVQRLPADLYWSGLRIFGIRHFNGSIQEYHRSLDSYQERLRTFTRGEGDEVADTFHANWTGHLPAAPPDLWRETTIELNAEEARFLAEQFTLYAPDSLLAHLVKHPSRNLESIGSPWQHSAISQAPPKTQVVVEHSRLFAEVMQGAAFAYNLMLATEAKASGIDIGDNHLDDNYAAELAGWADKIAADHRVQTWDVDETWHLLHEQNPRIPPSALRFASDWITHAKTDPLRITKLPEDIRDLISNREWRLKKGKARLRVRRALEMWSGASGTGLLSYRWGTGRTVLADIHRALANA